MFLIDDHNQREGNFAFLSLERIVPTNVKLAQLDPAARQLAQRMRDYLEKKSVAAAMRTMKEIAAGVGRHLAGAEKAA